MRRGIGLRGYAQQDPLNEFKREAFQLYDELRGLIRHGVASSIFRVTVTRQPAATESDPARGRLARRGSGGADRRERCQRSGRRCRDGRRDRWRRGRCACPGGCRGRRVGHPARRPARATHLRPMRATLGDQPVTGDGVGPAAGAGGPKPGFTPGGARIGRNDPCWCGSGAKYKKCHGR